MQLTKKTILIGLLAGALAVAGVFGVAGLGAYNYVSAKFTPAVSGQTGQGNSILADYWSVFVKQFAANLGVDQGKLDKAFSDAISSTVDQAVKDGKLTQAQADSIKSRNSQGLSGANGMNPFGRGFGNKMGPEGKVGMRGVNVTTADIASALGMSEADLTSGLESGKSISDLAKAQNKDLASVKSDLLAAVKARLDAAVKAGSLPQAQADTIYQKLSTSIDSMLTNANLFHGKGGPNGAAPGPMMGGVTISPADIAAALGMQEADVTSGLQSGKSVADLAKSQNKDLGAVKDAILATQKDRLDKAVAAGSLTQATADSVYQHLSANIDTLLNHPGGFFGMPGRRGGPWNRPDGGGHNNQNPQNKVPSGPSSRLGTSLG